MNCVNCGWVKVYRSLIEHPRSSDPAWVTIWIHLMLLATHKSIKMVFGKEVISLNPGQLIISRKSLSKKTGVHESSVERVLKTMIFEQQIEQRASSVSRLITIRNWEQYQQIEQPSEQRANSERTASEQRANTNKNDKNVRREEDNALVLEIYDCYPKKVDKARALKAIEKSLRKISAEELKAKTIAYAKSVSASDPQFIPYPATWFNGERYNDQVATNTTSNILSGVIDWTRDVDPKVREALEALR